MLWWRSSPATVEACTRSAMAMADAHGYDSLAMPLFGSGSGGLKEDLAEQVICRTLDELASPIAVRVVRFRRSRS